MTLLLTTVSARHAAPPPCAAPAAPPVFLTPAARAVLALDARGCRWPQGALDEETFGFCGAPRQVGSAYCKTHRRASHAGGAL